jgi:NitT/TauT family transport system permease protein
MKSKIIKIVLPLIFAILIWEVCAIIIGNDFLLPGIGATLESLFNLIANSTFYKAVFFTVLRVLTGLISGCVIGFVLAILCYKLPLLGITLTPIITIVKATPVASFIVLFWVMMSGNFLSIFIGFLMVMPIIYQNTSDAFSSVDKNLLEVAQIFEFSPSKRFRLVIFPVLKKYLVPAIITASSLAWKAEIAAEIIAYTKNSIGQGINDAKYNLDSPTVFAWTMVIILFSVILENLSKWLLKRLKWL